MKRTARHPPKDVSLLRVSALTENQMTTRLNHLRKVLVVASLQAIAVGLVFAASAKSLAQKLRPEDVVTWHLESIGSSQQRAAIKTRILSGTSQVVFHTTPVGQAVGRAVLASEDVKSLLGMSFPSPVYPREELGFDGSTFMAAYILPGSRSALGSFLMTHSLIFKQGLMGGTLSSAWPLLDLTRRHAELEYLGEKKVGNQILHELKYVPRGGSDLQIKLYFDQDTFKHVRTEYERTIAGVMGNRSYVSPGNGRETRFKMVEEFSDFKKEGGLNLPHTYAINLIVDTDAGTFVTDWTIKLTQFTFNEKIDPSAFTIITR
jgi:hypothetical protein